MKKGIFIKLAILLVVAALLYGVFWFFKIGQVEKQIRNFVSENSSHISVKEISVSGFPLSQKITIKDLKFTIPNPLLEGKQVVVKHLEATAGVFSNEFELTLIDPVVIEYDEGTIANVAFSKNPEITVVFSDGGIADFKYKDFGYRITNAAEDVLYSASSSNIDIKTVLEDGGKIKISGKIELKDVENLGMIDAYKATFEKQIVDGLKTGKITIDLNKVDEVQVSTIKSPEGLVEGITKASELRTANLAKPKVGADVVAKTIEKTKAAMGEAIKNVKVPELSEVVPIDPVAKAQNPVEPVANKVIAKNPATLQNQSNQTAETVAKKVDAVLPPMSANNMEMAKDNVMDDTKGVEIDTMQQDSVIVNDGEENVSVQSPSDENQGLEPNVGDFVSNGPKDMIAAVTNNELVKNNFFIDFEYVLTPNKSEEQLQIPSDPTQIQDIPVQYSKVIKVNKMDFSNPLYKISVSGQMSTFVDDDMPSGSLKVSVDKIDNLVNYLSAAFSQILKERFSVTPIQEAVDVQESAQDNDTTDQKQPQQAAKAMIVQEPIIVSEKPQDLYKIFLENVILNLGEVSREVAANNSETKDSNTVFEVKREKNLEFLINGSSVREILGKF